MTRYINKQIDADWFIVSRDLFVYIERTAEMSRITV